MTPTNEEIRGAVAEQAVEWFLANQYGSLKEADNENFVAWLRASPINVEEYLAVAGIARDLPNAMAPVTDSLKFVAARERADGEQGAAPIPRLPARRRLGVVLPDWIGPVRLRAAPVGVLVFLLAAFSLLWMNRSGLFGLPSLYRTIHGQQSSWVLQDGTLMRLNTDSFVTAQFTGTERVVEITRGQVYFQVAHDARRQFRVAIGGADIVAVGTRFDVYRRGSKTILTVVEGQVAVFAAGAPPPTSRATVSGAANVRAGQRLSLDSSVASAALPESIDVHQAEAWLNRQIIFERRPLGEVADEFNRYAQSRIEIPDPSLRAVLVSGVFNAYDSDSFLAFIQAKHGLVIRKSPEGGSVVRDIPPRSPAPLTVH